MNGESRVLKLCVLYRFNQYNTDIKNYNYDLKSLNENKNDL